MATPFVLLHKLFFFITIHLSFIFTTDAKAHVAIAKPQRINLIHRDSVYSPYYNPNATISDRAKRAIESSIARFAYINAKATMISGSSFQTNDNRAGVVAEDGGAQFMANISIGQPPVIQLMTMDTGSNLLWVQCLPCTKCFEQSSPIFDPSKSSTYVDLSCDSPNCIVFPRDPNKCDQFKHCKYNMGYLDGTTTIGTLATETLTFETSDEGVVTVDNVIIGCGHDNDGYNGQPSGILGLGPENISLVSRLGSKFSYCIGSIYDPHYAYNQLILGDGAKIEGDSTPLEVFNELYYLTLESISVGEKKLNIDPEVFKRTPSGDSGVVIDSGSTVTFLVLNGFNPLSDEVKSLLTGVVEPVPDPQHPTRLCFKGNISRDLVGFPVVTFDFAGGVQLGLDIGSMFQENGSDEFCMAIMESSINDLTVIGTLAQQNYNVAYDLAAKTVSFQRIDCQLLEN